MNGTFLKHYNDELDSLRGQAQRFAERHPKIAGRLRLSPNTVDDPHVERLLQGVAFAVARIRQRIDDSFPELTTTLLDTLYPHYLAPFPSAAIVQLRAPEDLDNQRVIPRGMVIESEMIEGEACVFRTTQAVDLWPIALTEATLTGMPLHAPAPHPAGAVSVLRLSLATTKADVDFAALAPEKLRFFIRAPWSQAVELFDLLHNQVAGIAIAEHPEDKTAVFYGASHIKPVGFADDEALLPRLNRSFQGYMLLSEFFGFAEKFFFFEVSGLSGKAMMLEHGNRLSVCIYLKEWKPDLAQKVNASSFALGCTPVINLFERKAEPITFDGTRTDYIINPDARHFKHMEVYTVDRVSMASKTGNVFDAPAFFGLHQRAEQSVKDAAFLDEQVFWQFRHVARNGGPADHACLSLFDANLHPAALPDYTATLDVTCFNRDLPAQLTFGAGRPHLRCHATEAVQATCLTAPQPALRPALPEDGHWRLLSHLMLNHLSLCGADGAGATQAAETLRAILTLYDCKQLPETRSLIEGISAVSSVSETARLADGGIARGLKITVVFAHHTIDKASAFFMTRILERFFGLYCSINSFTRVVAGMDNAAEPFFSGAPLTGERWLS